MVDDEGGGVLGGFSSSPSDWVFGYVLLIEMCGMVSIKINTGMWKSSGNYLLKKRKGD